MAAPATRPADEATAPGYLAFQACFCHSLYMSQCLVQVQIKVVISDLGCSIAMNSAADLMVLHPFYWPSNHCYSTSSLLSCRSSHCFDPSFETCSSWNLAAATMTTNNSTAEAYLPSLRDSLRH